jgi:NADH:ubiquinone reductase (H+-translocating)
MKEKPELLSLNIPASDKPRIVIIGGGFGSINIIKLLNRRDFQLVLLDRYNYHTFQPLLYQVATAGLEPDSVAGSLRQIIKKNKNFHFRMLKVNSIDTDRKTISSSAGDLTYDFLIIANGSRINYYGNDSIAEHAFPLKQIPHALDLRSHIFQQFEKQEILRHKNMKKKHMTFVVVGAGPTGVELCGALAELKRHVLPKDYPELELDDMQICLIEAQDRVLPSMSPQSGEKAEQYLRKLGVRILLNCQTEELMAMRSS